VNWNNGGKRTIWLGSGEVNSSRSSYAGMGVFKSSNNGKTWDYLGLPSSITLEKYNYIQQMKILPGLPFLAHFIHPEKKGCF
jgi:hypothetical protein